LRFSARHPLALGAGLLTLWTLKRVAEMTWRACYNGAASGRDSAASHTGNAAMLKKILVAVLLLLLAFVIVVALQPAEFSVARSTTIAAPVADVFPHVNDFHKWEAWSPWAKLDPNAKLSFEGPPEGAGTVMTWSGNDKVGEGKMTLVDSAPDEHVNIKVDFVKPFEGSINSGFGSHELRRQAILSLG
jgi:hypothetical protein